MNVLTIENKKYILVPEKEYENLVTKAAAKIAPAKRLSLVQGKKRAYKLIDKWVKEN